MKLLSELEAKLVSKQKAKLEGIKSNEFESKHLMLSEVLSRPFFKTEQHEVLFKQAGILANRFSTRAAEIDETGRFAFENFQELKDSNYVSLTVPKKYGGKEISLYEFLLLQERISQGDASTALSIGWHLGVIYDLREKRSWKEEQFEQLCREVVQDRVLINRVVTEPVKGSLTRSGKLETSVCKKNDKWVLSGRKSYNPMAPALDYSLVTATIEETGDIGVFWVDHLLCGVSVEENWDMQGIHGTRNDDLIFNKVELPLEALVETENEHLSNFPKGWLLHVPACFLGVAIAARNYALTFAAEYKLNSMPGSIKDVSEVQREIGEMELELLKARHVLYSIAHRWDEEPEKRAGMGAELAAAKHVAVNSANVIVDLAMRIVGGKSPQRSNPLQRYSRDVREGLHNPPMDDAVITLLARKALVSFK